MKQKTIKYSKLLFFSLLFIFTSCDKDASAITEEHGHKHGKNPNEVSMAFFKEVTHIESIELFLKEKMNTSTLMNRMESYKFSDFRIDTEVIYECALRDGETAFSFRLYPNEGIAEPDEMFNLVISRIEGQWRSTIYLLTIDPDERNVEKYNGVEAVYRESGIVTPIDNASRTPNGYTITLSYHCTNTGKCLREGKCNLCKLCVSRTVTYSFDFDEQEPDTPVFTINEGGTGSGSANPHQEQEKKPCEILKQQSINQLNFGKKLDSIKQRVLATNPNRDVTETMISVRRSGDQYIYTATNTTTVVNGYLVVTGEMTTSDVAVMHNHPVGTIPIFSAPDIVDFFISYNYVSESRKNEFTSYLVSFNNTTYALRMENTEALAALFTGLDLNSAEGKKEAEKKVEKIFKIHNMKTNQNYTQEMAENLFIDVMNDEKLGGGNGINLYRKDGNTWGKLTRLTNEVINKENCN